MPGLPESTNSYFRNKKFWLVLLGIGVAAGLSSCLLLRGGHKDVWPVARPIDVPGQGFTVFVAGDIANCKKHLPPKSGAAKTAALIAPEFASNKDSAVLLLGDATYPVGRLEEFAECYEPTWGQFKARTYPAPGNHEYYTPGAVGYFAYFGAAARPQGRSYYSVELGKWHVISLNSNLTPAEHLEQLAWLKADLDSNKAACTLAYWHHPVFSSGGHGSNENMVDVWRMLDAANADVVLASHDHNYERFAPQDAEGRRNEERGIRSFVVGTGGTSLTPFGLRKTNSAVSTNVALGVLRMVLKDTGYEWEFMAVPGTGFTDRGAALCH
ncbi:hypothetical protein BH11PSE11_BH11PSE11_23410 [soil metagenome]